MTDSPAADLSRLQSFIWSIADDVLRDVYVRGKYRDVILPMTVIRRLDTVLEPTKDKVLESARMLAETGIQQTGPALMREAKQHFYNTSAFTLKQLLGQPKQLRANF
ncbi:MAG: type I restriction-modification system subunit M N-terminal domain-containing protein, partial [Thermomicrobiales bacterium]